MASSSNINPGNVELTTMRVTYNGVDLGGTSGGVKVSIKNEYSDIMIDQLGKTVIDSILSGQAYSVKLVLSETKNKDNWKVAFPNAKLITSGPNKSLYMDAQVGASLYASAQALILHPLQREDSDLAGDYKFFKCAAKSAVEIEYGPDKQVGLEVEFMVFPDQTTNPARFFIHGDPTIGLTAATAGTPAFTGTGTGTMTAVSAGSAAKTETITATCIGVNGANKSAWKVVGSVSGAIGTVELTGSAGGTGVFISSVINFTLTDASTDFVAGDLFTVAMTAANYA